MTWGWKNAWSAEQPLFLRFIFLSHVILGPAFDHGLKAKPSPRSL